MLKDFISTNEIVGESKHFYNYQTLVCEEHGEFMSATFTLKGESRATSCPVCVSHKRDHDYKKQLKEQADLLLKEEEKNKLNSNK